VRERRPELVPAQHPAAFDPLGARSHRTQDIGPAAGLGQREGIRERAVGDPREQLLALFGRAVQQQRLGARPDRDPPQPGEPAQRAGQLLAHDALVDDVAALPAERLGHADPVQAGAGDARRQLRRVFA
jgi:hypothetical protein